MMLDLQAMVSDAQDLTLGTGTYLSDNSIDLGSVSATDNNGNTIAGDPGKGDVTLEAQVVTAFTTAAGGTLQVNLVMADDEALSSNLVTLRSSAVLAAATLVAGYKVRIAGELPIGVTKRYVGLQYVIGTGSMTAGKITAGIINTRQADAYQ